MEQPSRVDQAERSCQVKEGQSAAFTSTPWPDRRFTRRSTGALRPANTGRSSTYETVLEVDNSERLLRPGMPLTCRDHGESALTTPLLCRTRRCASRRPLRAQAPQGGCSTRCCRCAASAAAAAEGREGEPQAGARVLCSRRPAEAVAVTTGRDRPAPGPSQERRLSSRCGVVTDAASGERSERHRGPRPTPVIELTRGSARSTDAGEAASRRCEHRPLHRARDFVAVMGPSGSGKSTCMNILGCLGLATSGSYRFDGVEVGHLSRDQRARLRRNYLGLRVPGLQSAGPQHGAQRTWSCRLVYPRALRRRPAAARRARRSAGRPREPGAHRPTLLPAVSNSASRSRRAIVTTPEVLLADEPTGGNLDSGEGPRDPGAVDEAQPRAGT